jgi:tetratricopeptide (TPR) repeat protein
MIRRSPPRAPAGAQPAVATARVAVRRPGALPAVAAALCLLALSPAAAGSGASYGDFVRAARLLRSWQYEEAEQLIAGLSRAAPRAPELRYLEAELAFARGNYGRAVELTADLPDGAMGGSAGELKALARSTRETTRQFRSRPSPGGHFEIWAAPGKDDVIVELVGSVLEAAYEVFRDDFGFVPPETVRVEILGAPRDLAQLSTLTAREIETTGTIALCKYGKLMVVSPRATLLGYPWMDTLVHEYVHYVVSRLSHDTVPVWLHEGLARFQQTRWRSPPGGSLTRIDEHLLATALRRNALIPFDDMHPSMAKLPSQEAAALAFAEVFTMVRYLHGKVGYAGIRDLLARQREGVSARRAVAEVMGRRWEEVERDWQKYLRDANLRTSDQVAARAQAPRIRFRRGSDPGARDEQEENVGLDEVKSARARRFTRLAGLLRARGLSEAAAIEYEKAWAVAPQDPFIAAKLSRTYVELGQHRKAIELARPLAQLDEHDVTAQVTLGASHLALGDMAGARTAFEAALRVSPFDPAVRCGLAQAYTALKQDRLARREQGACDALR